MFRREKRAIIVCVLYLVSCPLYLSSISFAQDEKIIERYKLMLSRNPKEEARLIDSISSTSKVPA